MNNHLLTALEPLVFGTGRTFSSDPGSLAGGGLLLPSSSQLAGAVRTAAGEPEGGWAAALDTEVHGPLLTLDGAVLVSAPSNMVPMARDGALELQRSRPIAGDPGFGTDLPGGLQPTGLNPTGLEPTKDDGPRWLTLAELTQWMLGTGAPTAPFREGPPSDERMHVGLDFATRTAATGRLFATRGTALGPTLRKTGPMACVEEGYGLLVRTSAVLPPALFLGGERRQAAVSPWTGEDPFVCPATVREGLVTAKRVAMVLATAADFGGGWKPDPKTFGLPGARLVSAVARRREAVSGFDYATRAPKAIRWLVPAGAVFFYDLDAPVPALADRWLTPVNSDLQASRDGFGLAMFFPTDW